MTYQSVTIDQLVPGSYVVEVLKQTGEVEIKHAGWVRTPEAIKQLKNKGVQVVAIDPTKQLFRETPVQEKSTEADPIAFRAVFADEYPRAERSLAHAIKIQTQVLQDVAEGKQVDLRLIHEVSAGLSDSVGRNPDVLLYLTRIASQSNKLLQHSVNCAVYMAAFTRFLNYPKHKVQSLITAALLHDVGKAQNAALLTQPDSAAISTSLMALQKNPLFIGDVSLWISQHCAYLDGSGAPAIKGNQIEAGSRILAIINLYEQLTDTEQGSGNPLLAIKQLLAKTPDQLDAELLQQFIQCIGIYPPGSVVRLTTGRLALVLENTPKKPMQPTVKVFYHSVHHHHIIPKIINLSRQRDEQIEACVDLKKYNLDAQNYL